jgi:hypothetical protein
MRRVLTTVLAVALLLGLGALAVLALPNGSAPLAGAPAVSAAAPEFEPDAPNAGGKYNQIGLPLDNRITLASALVNDINATTGGTATQAFKWDPNNGYSLYDPNDPFSVDFSLKVGDPVLILMEGTAGNLVYSMVGDVPAQGSVKFNLVGATPCKLNHITLPLDKGSITLASQLTTAIGDVSQVLVWDPNNGYTIYDPQDPFSQDFSVRIGYPYFVCTTASKTWPQ